LLLHEGRSVIYVARQLGHSAQLTMRVYGHVIEELDDAPRISAEDAITAARAEEFGPMFGTGQVITLQLHWRDPRIRRPDRGSE
jgi:hypothetical protein